MEPLGNGAVSSLLSGLFGMVVDARNAFYDRTARFVQSAPFPTISVGGISSGGTGKTPMAKLIAAYALRRGYDVAFLSRGYRRKTRGAIVSEPGSIDTWEKVGDEPAMLHAALPQSWLSIGADRFTAAKAVAPRLSPRGVFILDDGFQHRKLKRDLDIVCLPADPFGDLLLPSGTLREPMSNLRRAHCACCIGTAEETSILETSRIRIEKSFSHTLAFVLHQIPVGWVNVSSGEFMKELSCKRAVVLCGIARPQRFLFFLKKMRIPFAAQSIFPDHHEYQEGEIASILESSNASSIVTTEKDAIRLKTLKLVSRPDIWYLKLDLQFPIRESERLFCQLIDKTLKYCHTS